LLKEEDLPDRRAFGASTSTCPQICPPPRPLPAASKGILSLAEEHVASKKKREQEEEEEEENEEGEESNKRQVLAKLMMLSLYSLLF